MTRFARGGPANKKKPHKATPWHQFEKGNTEKEPAKKSLPEKLQPSPSYKGFNTPNISKVKEERHVSKPRLVQSNKSIDETSINNLPTWSDGNYTLTQNKSCGIALELEQLGKDEGMVEEVKTVVHKKKKQKQKNMCVSHVSVKDKVKHQVTNSKKQELLETELTVNLKKVKDSIILTKDDEKELAELIKKDQRREKRRLKRLEKKADLKLCFNCRKKGHTVADCPELKKGNADEQGTGICFKCGSTEHALSKCRLKLPQGQFPYAKCFICGEQGHLSKQCPDNPRGLYPKGGCCNICSSVEHYKKDCPELQKEQGIGDYTLTTCQKTHSADEEVSLFNQSRKPVSKKAKIVKF